MIAIICAMDKEFIEVSELMRVQKYEDFCYFKIAYGKIGNKDCIVALCGVGKVHAAICTQSIIMRFHPEIILNVGVAGAIDETLNVGDTVVADYLIQHDFDISAFPNRKKGEISGINLVAIETTKWIRNEIFKCTSSVFENNSFVGTILTGDQFINSKEKLKDLKNCFGGLACEMEAGSIAQTCYLGKVPFAVIRTISDKADSHSETDFYSFLEKSSKNAARLLKVFIESI